MRTALLLLLLMGCAPETVPQSISMPLSHGWTVQVQAGDAHHLRQVVGVLVQWRGAI